MPATFDTDFRGSEYLEAKAFPEYVRTPVPAPASVRAAWNYRDDMDAINEAELALERGCGLWERHIHLATLAGRTAGEARAAAFARFQRAYSDAVALEGTAAALKAVGLGAGALSRPRRQQRALLSLATAYG